MNKLRAMEVFITVAEAGSFTAAAKILDISAVMVGKIVAQLEDELRIQLLKRNTRRQHLTEVGKIWYRESLGVLANLRSAENRIAGLRSLPAGNLRISCPHTLGSCIIAGLCAEFRQDFPDITVTLELSDRVVDILAEGFDFAIRIGRLPEDSPLVPIRLGDYRMVIAAAPAYIARYGIPESRQALTEHCCLHNSAWNKRNVWRDGSRRIWPENATFSCNNGHALKEAALAGAGLIFQPELLLAADIASGRLVTVLEEIVPPARPIHLIWHQDLRASGKHRSFIDWMQQRIQGVSVLHSRRRVTLDPKDS